MTSRPLDPYELGGMALTLDVEESDVADDLLEFRRLAEIQNMQFADTVIHPDTAVSLPSLQQESALEVALEAAPQGAPHKFQAVRTGIAGMDFEHAQLMRQLERVYDAVDLETASSGIGKFIQAWNLHHQHEEQHMLAQHYPDLAAHQAQHARLMDQYQFMQKEAMHSEAELASVKAYVKMVAKMVADHIARVDVLYVNWGASSPT
jgi:hemerythrin-like metal-binding protein